MSYFYPLHHPTKYRYTYYIPYHFQLMPPSPTPCNHKSVTITNNYATTALNIEKYMFKTWNEFLPFQKHLKNVLTVTDMFSHRIFSGPDVSADLLS
jgi:hypothetical protein